MEKKATIVGLLPSKPLMNSVSWSRVRTDSVVGISGTISASAACSTLSDSNEMPGGQSRKITSYSPLSGASKLAILRAGFFAASSTRSRFR